MYNPPPNRKISRQKLAGALERYRHYMLILPLFIVLSLCGSTAANAQTIIKGWTFGAESSQHIDVSYSIVQCASTTGTELHLQVFNENAAAATAKFNVEIADAASNQSFTTLVNRPLTVGELVMADCANTAVSNLKIALPSNYDPTAVTVTITFIP